MKILQFKRGISDSDFKRTSLTPGELYINTNNDSVWVGKENGQFQIGSYQSVVTDISANQSETDPTKVVLNITKRFANGATSTTPITADISGTVAVANRLTTGSTSNQKIFYLNSGSPVVNTGVIGTGSASKPIYYNNGFKEITSLDIGQIKVTTITGQLNNKLVKFNNCALTDIEQITLKNLITPNQQIKTTGFSNAYISTGKVYIISVEIDGVDGSHSFVLDTTTYSSVDIWKSNSVSIQYDSYQVNNISIPAYHFYELWFTGGKLYIKQLGSPSTNVTGYIYSVRRIG